MSLMEVQLEFMNRREKETKEKRGVVVDVGCNHGANKNGSEGQVQVVNVT